jgi:glycosyltransferase involved in cell wall biosynthesis
VIKIPADIYHICKPHPQNSFAGILATKLLNRGRLFLDCDDFEAGINRFSSSWQQPIIAWLEDGLPHLVDGVTVHSRFLENRVQGLGIPRERILRVPSGIDTKRFRYVSSVSTKNWRKRLKLYGSHHIVAFIGTMALVSHPVDLLLEAFAKLSSKQKVILLLVGGGPDLPQLKKLASKLKIIDQTRFVGRVNPDEIPSLLSLADVSVDPVYDNKIAKARWPVKIMESIALGIPVVTGDVGDREEILGGKAGILVSPGSVDALANGLETVLIDSSLRKNLSKGCEIQAAKYDLEDLALQLLAFYGDKIEIVG